MRRLILFIFFVLIAIQTWAQQSDNGYHHREIIIQSGDTLIRANILTEEYRGKISDKRVYFWFSKETIHSNAGGFSGKLLHGTYKAFLDNNLIEAGQYRAGLKEGNWMSWYPSGKTKRICVYKKGELSGSFMTLNENGEILINGKIKNNELCQKVNEGKAPLWKRILKFSTNKKSDPQVTELKSSKDLQKGRKKKSNNEIKTEITEK